MDSITVIMPGRPKPLSKKDVYTFVDDMINGLKDKERLDRTVAENASYECN